MSEKPMGKQLFEASTIGLNLVLATFVGLGMGRGLDYLFDKYLGWKTYPWFTIGFLLLGIVAGFREMIKMARKISGNNKTDI